MNVFQSAPLAAAAKLIELRELIARQTPAPVARRGAIRTRIGVLDADAKRAPPFLAMSYVGLHTRLAFSLPRGASDQPALKGGPAVRARAGGGPIVLLPANPPRRREGRRRCQPGTSAAPYPLELP